MLMSVCVILLQAGRGKHEPHDLGSPKQGWQAFKYAKDDALKENRLQPSVSECWRLCVSSVTVTSL